MSGATEPIREKITFQGEIFNLLDADSAINAYEAVKRAMNECYYFQGIVKQALLVMAGDSPVPGTLATFDGAERKTRRVVGDRRTAKLTMPSTTFKQEVLQKLWNSNPRLAGKFLKIQSLAVNRREAAKLQVAGGNSDVVDFMETLRNAEQQPTSYPTVTIEDPSDNEFRGAHPKGD